MTRSQSLIVFTLILCITLTGCATLDLNVDTYYVSKTYGSIPPRVSQNYCKRYMGHELDPSTYDVLAEYRVNVSPITMTGSFTRYGAGDLFLYACEKAVKNGADGIVQGHVGTDMIAGTSNPVVIATAIRFKGDIPKTLMETALLQVKSEQHKGDISDENKNKEVLPCLQEKYIDGTGLILEVEGIHWQDKIIKFNMDMKSIPKEQREIFEKQNTALPQDSYLVFDVAIKNTSIKPLQLVEWVNAAPVFSLFDEKGGEYSAIGVGGGDMNNITTKAISQVMGGSGLNPNRSLKGTTIFDAPKTGSYQLSISRGKGGLFILTAGKEIMRCKVDILK